MTSSSMVLLGSLAACHAAAPPMDGVSHVERHYINAIGPVKMDVLVAIDDTAAMAPYQDRIQALPQAIVQSLDPGFDVRIAVTSNDGVLHRAPGVADPWLATRLDFALARTSNFHGSLADALAPLVHVGTTDPRPNQLLAAQQLALAGNRDHFLQDHFLRDDALLAVVTITATDDASPLPVADYAAWLGTIKRSTSVEIAGIYAMPAPRLDDLYNNLQGPPFIRVGFGPASSINGGDGAPAFPDLTIVKVAGGAFCWHASDVDPETPGPQYDCTFTAQIAGAPRSLPPCTVDPEPPCWELVPSLDDACMDADALRPVIHGYRDFVFFPALAVECVVDR